MARKTKKRRYKKYRTVRSGALKGRRVLTRAARKRIGKRASRHAAAVRARRYKRIAKKHPNIARAFRHIERTVASIHRDLQRRARKVRSTETRVQLQDDIAMANRRGLISNEQAESLHRLMKH